MVKNPLANVKATGDTGSVKGQKVPLEEETATLSTNLAGRIPCKEEPGGLQSKGLQRVGHD